MKLMEIVRGRESSSQTIATSSKLSKKLNKVGVVVGNCLDLSRIDARLLHARRLPPA